MAYESDKKPEAERKVGKALGAGIVFLPYIFSWFTLRKGHTKFARIASFSWLGVVLLPHVFKPPSNRSDPSAASSGGTPTQPVEVFFHDTNPRTPCRELADMFSTSSNQTELQMDEAFKSMKGQLFQYSMRVKAVEVTFGSISLQAACPQKKNVLDMSDFILSVDDAFKPQMSQLNKGAAITVCGRFKGYTRFTGLHGDLVALGPCPNAKLHE